MNTQILKKIFSIKALLIILLLFILFYVTFVISHHFLEPKAYDFLVRSTTKDKASTDIVNVIIDDESLNRIGRWPWKRATYADIFDYLENHSGAKVVVFDSILTSYGNKKDDREFLKKIKRFNSLTGGVLFSRKLNQASSSNNIEKFALNVKNNPQKPNLNNFEYYSIDSMKEYLDSLSGIGSVIVKPDSDGVIRRIEPIFKYKQKFYPSLAVAAYIKATGENKFIIENKNFKTHNFKIPIKNKPVISTLIKWYKPYEQGTLSAHKNYSAWKIIKSYNLLKKNKPALLPKEEFKGKIVVVGATASALNDIKITPMGVDYPGVDIQSTFINNLIDNKFIKPASFITKLLILSILIIVAFSAIVCLPPFLSFIALMSLMFGYFQICIYSYSNLYAIDIITPEVFIMLCIAVGYGYKYFVEGQKKEQIKKIMGKYVSNELMKKIVDNIDYTKLGGKKANITALFADIRDFTSISENLPPEELSDLLNEYYSQIAPIIEKHNGMINKYMGDAILAIFGAPIEDNNHPQNAIKCAVEMVEEVEKIKKKWEKENKPKINIGIGISSGEAFAGNIGSEDRLEYTIIGDTVNLASRIESKNSTLKTNLLVSEETHNKIKDFVVSRQISSVSIKGKSKTVDIYEIIELTNQNHQ